MGAISATALNAFSRVLLDDDSSGFDLLQFFGNASEYLKKIGHYIMIFAGIILVIVGVVQIAKGLAGGGRGQVNWVMSICCLLIGGVLLVGGWNLAVKVAAIGKDTLEEMGGGDIIGDADSVEGGIDVNTF